MSCMYTWYCQCCHGQERANKAASHRHGGGISRSAVSRMESQILKVEFLSRHGACNSLMPTHTACHFTIFTTSDLCCSCHHRCIALWSTQGLEKPRRVCFVIIQNETTLAPDDFVGGRALCWLSTSGTHNHTFIRLVCWNRTSRNGRASFHGSIQS